MTYRTVRMVPGNLHFIWQFHPKRKLSNSSAILNQVQDGHSASPYSLKSSTLLSLMSPSRSDSRCSGVSRAKAGGEGSRTPVLKTVVPNFYMRSRSSYRVSLADRRATLTLVSTK
jgi:hypothetical protein